MATLSPIEQNTDAIGVDLDYQVFFNPSVVKSLLISIDFLTDPSVINPENAYEFD